MPIRGVAVIDWMGSSLICPPPEENRGPVVQFASTVAKKDSYSAATVAPAP
jgi:hypothetical protein